MAKFERRMTKEARRTFVHKGESDASSHRCSLTQRASRIGKHTRTACESLRARDEELLPEVRDSRRLSESPVPRGRARSPVRTERSLG